MNKKIKLKVKAMTCPSCEMLIKDILDDEDITTHNISYKTGDLEIEYNENKISLEDIKILLKKEGHPIEDNK